MTKKQRRHDHTALIALNKANPTLRWQFKGTKFNGATYWQTLPAHKKPLFWAWKEYRILPGQDTGVSAEEKEAVAKSIIRPDAWEALSGGKHAVVENEDTVNVLRKILRKLQDVGLVQIEDAPGNEEFITMDMTERQRVDLIASIKYITRNGKEIEQ